MNAYNPRTEELEFIAGDAVVQQRGSMDRGMTQTTRLDKAALGHPLIRYQAGPHARVIEADVYYMPTDDGTGTPGLEVILICPCCEHELRVTSLHKAIEYTPAPELDTATGEVVIRGTISIAPFQCTWEKDTKTAVTGHGENLCRWRVGIDKNIALDHR